MGSWISADVTAREALCHLDRRRRSPRIPVISTGGGEAPESMSSRPEAAKPPERRDLDHCREGDFSTPPLRGYGRNDCDFGAAIAG